MSENVVKKQPVPALSQKKAGFIWPAFFGFWFSDNAAIV